METRLETETPPEFAAYLQNNTEQQVSTKTLTDALEIVNGPTLDGTLIQDWGECVGCGEYKMLNWKIVNVKNKEVNICEDCAQQIRQEKEA